MTKTLTHLPTHQGKITVGRIANTGEVITCKSCRKAFEWNLAQAARMGDAAIESINGNAPLAYKGQEIMHASMMSSAAARHAARVIDYSL